MLAPTGIRQFRVADMDKEYATAEEPFRDDRLRELVDRLPESQRMLVSLTFFGQKSLAEAGKELKIKNPAPLRDQALAQLRQWLSDGSADDGSVSQEDGVGSLSAGS